MKLYIAIIFLAAALHSETFAKSQMSVPLNNVRQLAMAIIAFHSDHEALPSDQKSLQPSYPTRLEDLIDFRYLSKNDFNTLTKTYPVVYFAPQTENPDVSLPILITSSDDYLFAAFLDGSTKTFPFNLQKKENPYLIFSALFLPFALALIIYLFFSRRRAEQGA